MTLRLTGTGSTASGRSGGVCAATWITAALIAVNGCANEQPHRRNAGHPAARHESQTGVTPRPPAAVIRVPQPDFANPASVAASFFTAWASTDSVHDGPGAYLARCSALVTPALRHQLAASQPASAAWQGLRAEHLVSLVRIDAVTRPNGGPPPTRTEVFLRVYAERVTTTTAGRSVTADGATLQLVRRGHRWLVARLLFY